MNHVRSRSVNLSNWRLSRKLAVLLAIPILAAVVFGALRVTTQLDEAQRFDVLSEQVAIIPALFDFSNVVVSASTAISLGLPPISNQEHIAESTQNLELHADSAKLSAPIAERITQLIADGRTIYDNSHSSGMSTEELGQHTIDFLIRCEAAFRTVLDLAENTEILTAGTNMLNAWNAQRTLLDQANALALLGRNPEAAHIITENALNVEESTLLLLQDTSLDQGKLDELLSNLVLRQTQLADLVSGRGTEAQLNDAMLAAFVPYQDMNGLAIVQITTTLDQLISSSRTTAIRDAAIIAAILVTALIVALAVARALSRPLRRLRDSTLASAHDELPAAIAAIKDGADIDTVRLAPIDLHTTEEIGELARAVDSMNSEAIRLAGEQAHLRRQVATMLETLARRHKTLVEQQLSLIESLEYREKDPLRLQSLFSLDHLAARILRTGDSLLVLAGSRSRVRTAPTPLNDILRGAVSQVENYQRVRIGRTPSGYLVGVAVSDVVHLLAELVDNALRASPPTSPVTFEFSTAVGGGLLLEIADSGIGVPPETLDDINNHLAAGNDAEFFAPRQMGLYVVGRLAARNGMSVRLRPTFDSDTNAGITVSVYFPPPLLVDVGYAVPEQMMERPRRLPRHDDRTQHHGEPESAR